jgi:hypothetical protein
MMDPLSLVPAIDPDRGLSESERRRWEGALAALEAVLGWRSSLVDNLDL